MQRKPTNERPTVTDNPAWLLIAIIVVVLLFAAALGLIIWDAKS